MKKAFSTAPTFLFFLFSIIFTTLSCRKTDKIEDLKAPEVVTINNIENRFFNEHTSSVPSVKNITTYIKEKNDSLQFVNKTVNQIGYPRWDKTIIVAKPKASGRGNSDSSNTTYYVPFVRDSQNYVNASMIINASATDTTFFYKCDWQYGELQNNNSVISDSAEYFAVFFMMMDKSVFG